MNFNPFEHFGELVYNNIDGGPIFGLSHHDTIPLPDGHMVASAVEGHPETLTYWMNTGGSIQQITETQGFAQGLWLHFAYGAELPGAHSLFGDLLGLSHELHVSDQDLVTAIMGMPELLGRIVAAGVTQEQVLAYAHAEAPEVMLVGVDHGALIA